MGRFKKGNRAQRKDLWAMSGALEALVEAMRSVNISNRDTSYSSAMWSELALNVFNEDLNKNRHWLWVIWAKNRNGVRDLISTQHERSERSEAGETNKLLVNNREKIEISDEDIECNDAKDKQEISLETEGQTDMEQNEAEDKQRKMVITTEAKRKHGKTWRKLPVISKKFTITVDRKKRKKNSPTSRFNKTEATMDQCVLQEVQRKKSLLYPGLQESARQIFSKSKN